MVIPAPLTLNRSGNGTTGTVEKGIVGVNGWYCIFTMILNLAVTCTATVDNLDTGAELASGQGVAGGQIVMQWIDTNEKPAPFQLTMSVGGVWSYRLTVTRGQSPQFRGA